MNTQPPEKPQQFPSLLQIHSIFYTIQGEGPFTGTPAVFVRLAGCNLQCPGCDTDYTSNRYETQVESIVWQVQGFAKSGLVVITGGEPFRQNIAPLLNALVEAGYFVQIETNGTLPPPPVLYSAITDIRTGVYVVCSPKTGRIHPAVLQVACALKYVGAWQDLDAQDGLPVQALGHPCTQLARPPLHWHKVVYLQPMDSKSEVENKRNLEACIESCMRFGHTLQLQIHKIISVE